MSSEWPTFYEYRIDTIYAFSKLLFAYHRMNTNNVPSLVKKRFDQIRTINRNHRLMQKIADNIRQIEQNHETPIGYLLFGLSIKF